MQSPAEFAQTAAPPQRKRGRPPKPRDAQGNIIRDATAPVANTPAPAQATVWPVPDEPEGLFSEPVAAPVAPSEPAKRRGRPTKAQEPFSVENLADALEGFQVAKGDYDVAHETLVLARQRLITLLGRAGFIVPDLPF